MQPRTILIIKLLLPWLLISIACQTLLPEEPTATVEKPTPTPSEPTETLTPTLDEVSAIFAMVGTLTTEASDAQATDGALSEPTNAPYSQWDVDIMDSVNHVPDGTEVEYNTNPPSSGMHYSSPLPAGFYEEGDVNAAFPESHIVHSLEHGYVAIWYNCDILDEVDCVRLIAQILVVLELIGPEKVIVFPWHNMDVPLAMSSWGQWVLLEEFDAKMVAAFVNGNRSHPRSPEPNVP